MPSEAGGPIASLINDFKPTVLVTGGTGFLARHVIQKLHALGAEVRTTLRSYTRHDELLSAVDMKPGDLQAFECDLRSDANWAEAISNCTHVIHCASPFPTQQPRDPDLLVRPAVDGTLRMLRLAREAGISRVVLTSSMNAIAGGIASDVGKIYTEADWTILSDRLTPYDRSKTLAEQEAWRYVGEHSELELAVINPGAIFGPMLGTQVSASAEIVRSILKGGIPGVPRIGFGAVDVRDVADAHIAAMVDPAATGRRYICSLDEIWLVDIARALARKYAPLGFRVPTRELPEWFVKLGALFSPTLRRAADHLGRRRRTNNNAVRALLGRELIGYEEAVLATAESLITNELVHTSR